VNNRTRTLRTVWDVSRAGINHSMDDFPKRLNLRTMQDRILRRCSSGRTINATFKGRNSPGQTIPTRLRTHPHMSRDLRISIPIECSEANSDVVRLFRHACKHGRSATRTKAPPSAGRGLIFRYQIFTSNDTISVTRDSRVGRKGCSVRASAKLAVTKPNLADGSQNLEPEAATKALAPDKFRCHGAVFSHGQLVHL
jgi:hypothetical protein